MSLGAIPLVAALGFVLRGRWPARRTVPAEAVVESLRYAETILGGGDLPVAVYRTRIRFTDRDGKEVITETEPIVEHPVGSSLTIHHDPRNPRLLRTAPMEHYVCGACFATIGVFFMVMAVVI